MKQLRIMVLSKKKIKRRFLKITASIIGLYFIISLYFINHFFFHTEINGVNVSLKAHATALDAFNNYIDDYKLQLTGRDGLTEVITGKEIGLKCRENNAASQIDSLQNPLLWITALFKGKKYYVKGLYGYDADLLNSRLLRLKCLNGKIIPPKNASFKYKDGSYETIKETYGNKIKKDKLIKAVNSCLSLGKTSLDLNARHCYETPKFKLTSEKTIKTKNLLNKYVSTRITYKFGSTKEQLDGTIIHKWLSVNGNLDVVINRQAVEEYVHELSSQYNTVGISREFQTATGKLIEVKGGIYGWRINREAETEALLKNIRQGAVLEKEPVYLQKAVSREGNEIGDTYIEINITRQHLWLFKNGKLVVQGSVVTGNPGRGNATTTGVYMINYKQKNATLSGPGYEAPVTYWMPFFGNIGLHDASWRSHFGGNIYRQRGSHGCVNAPIYLAKKVFENIESGTPVVLYEE
ncbi:MAG TPA: L,D-transpeptidase family protein [Clostridiales bacterium]|nr:L,D-transpeptidase family protein [Clostridiales bacterium]